METGPTALALLFVSLACGQTVFPAQPLRERSQEWLRYQNRRWTLTACLNKFHRRVEAERNATQMTYYERRLPHWHPQGKAIFLTWRLHGSLPSGFLLRLGKETPASAGRAFRMADTELDKALHGPLWLNDPRVARCVVETIDRGAAPLEQYVLHAFVLMANHVHLLLEPRVPLAKITDGLKGVSAREANRILGRTGKRFWQGESFDHWVRNGAEFERIRTYVEGNPVTAGLVSKPEDWPWSSASRKKGAIP